MEPNRNQNKWENALASTGRSRFTLATQESTQRTEIQIRRVFHTGWRKQLISQVQQVKKIGATDSVTSFHRVPPTTERPSLYLGGFTGKEAGLTVRGHHSATSSGGNVKLRCALMRVAKAELSWKGEEFKDIYRPEREACDACAPPLARQHRFIVSNRRCGCYYFVVSFIFH